MDKSLLSSTSNTSVKSDRTTATLSGWQVYRIDKDVKKTYQF